MRWEVMFAGSSLLLVIGIIVWALRQMVRTLREPCPDHWFEGQ
jgi:hypothetical protein